MYNKTFVDILIADVNNDTYTKPEIDSTLSAYTDSIDLHNDFYSKAKMSIILDTYYNITEIQANYYDKVATDSLFSNIDLSNYYTKIEIGDIDDELSTLALNTYTKTEIDTQLTDYTTNAYLQGNYMTSISIAEPLMKNYATITLLGDNFYDKAYLDNQFSLTADVSRLAGLVPTGYLELKYTNSVDLTTDYYNKIETGNLLANKVSTAGDTTISGNLDVGITQAQTSITAYINHIGKTGYVEMEARWANQGYIHFKTNHTAGELFFAVKDSLRDKVYMYVGNDIVYMCEGTTTDGNLDVGTTGNNSIKIHGTGVAIAYAELKLNNG